MKQTRIVERKPLSATAFRVYWFVLEAVDPPAYDGKPLRYASARSRWADRTQVDPDKGRAAIAELHAWADGNGWAVVP